MARCKSAVPVVIAVAIVVACIAGSAWIVQSRDADGDERRVVLVSFGTMLDETEPFLVMTAKGTSVQAWEYAESLKHDLASAAVGGA